MQVTIDALAAWLKARDDFVLLGHLHPDGDAVGSCMAMRLVLKALGKRSVVVLPGGTPGLYAAYPGATEILDPAAALPFVPQTAFALDTAELERLGEGRLLFERCEDSCVLDHHVTNAGFGCVSHVDGSRCAAGELVLELMDALDVPLSREIAEWLFIAISTDSGNFRFPSVTPDTLRAVARLMEAGADFSRLTRALWYTRSRARTHLMGLVLAELQSSGNGRMAWAPLTEEMLRKSGARPEDSEGIVNFLLEIDGVEFACLASEQKGEIRCSLRSKDYLDVAAIASALGGGGHARAAGCTLPMPVQEALKTVLKRAEQALNIRDRGNPPMDGRDNA